MSATPEAISQFPLPVNVRKKEGLFISVFSGKKEC
jgi:hypothetical protein